jgi:gas vesicle protein
MDMQSLRRDLIDVAARRSLQMLREASPTHLRDLAVHAFMPRPSPVVPIVAAIGGLIVGAAIGAGVTAFMTPVTGPVLRKKALASGRKASKRAMEMSQSVASELGVTTPPKSARTLNGHSKKSHRSHVQA